MIKRAWPGRYDHLPARDPSTHIIQSWDTASKDGGSNDFSVCTTWLVQRGNYYLTDVLRGRFDYPTLRARAIDLAKAYRPHRILVEDTGVGTALIQELKRTSLTAIAIKPERDKLTRMSVQSGKFESGQVMLPRQAPWLAELEAELFAFPNSKHDDQVDSVSQALGHALSFYDPGVIANGLAQMMSRL
jgi:predicted phage terminase large subunit-like protein